VRLPDVIIYKLIKLQMSSAACKNKGFILDGYPRNINDAKSIFLTKIEDYEPLSAIEEENAAELSSLAPLYPGFTLNEDIIP
jgi:adenylate kinase family enzyme